LCGLRKSGPSYDEGRSVKAGSHFMLRGIIRGNVMAGRENRGEQRGSEKEIP